ncbi:MAG TPA: hypothetical protein VK835_11730 [Bacteroidia bacterium]|jgi:hypothetical protein|nr:hypothetical protein [Bacteroidia bacterium]
MKKHTINTKNAKAIEKKRLEIFFQGLTFVGVWLTLPDNHSKAAVLILLFLLISHSTIIKIGAVKRTKQHPKFIVAYRKYRHKYILTLVGLLLSGLLIIKETYQVIN